MLVGPPKLPGGIALERGMLKSPLYSGTEVRETCGRSQSRQSQDTASHAGWISFCGSGMPLKSTEPKKSVRNTP